MSNKYEPTKEELADDDDPLTRVLLGMTAVIAKVGKQRGIQGTVKCPSCETGEIHYSVAAYNGHIWGKCSTPHCCSWIQ